MRRNPGRTTGFAEFVVTLTDEMQHDLARLYITEHNGLALDLAPWLLLISAIIIVVLLVVHFGKSRKPYQVVQLNIQLGNIGSLQLKPNWEDIQIAHKIWTELVTRKAAIPIDPEHDVIIEVYDSWYALFQRVRQLVSEIPSTCIRRERSTQVLVSVAVETLNRGLRPHLTRWQAQFRNWWKQTEGALATATPQEHQRQYPHYQELTAEMSEVNLQLVQYAGQLEKIIRGQ